MNVDTLPSRDSVQLTIYNSVDLTMVRETRFLTLRQGLNHLEFSWANTLIDPTSVEFNALTHPDEVHVLDVRFPPRVTNILEWSLQSEFTGEVQVEILYFTSGITWSADYVLEASGDEKTASLAGFVTVKNLSGEDYENAQIRLVVGEVRLVQEIAKLAADRDDKEDHVLGKKLAKDGRGRKSMLQASLARAFRDDVEEAAKRIEKEVLSEYFLYTVEGRDTIPNGWSKRLPSLNSKSIPLTSYDKFESAGRAGNVERFYRFTNSIAGHLGQEPLPNGTVIAFRETSPDHLKSLVGKTSVKYIPVNESFELPLGTDREVMVEPVLTDWRKDDILFDKQGDVAGWTATQSWRIDVRNSREIPVTLDVRRNFQGDWSLKSNAPYEKVDATKIKFLIQLKPGEKRTVNYEIKIRQGTSATR